MTNPVNSENRPGVRVKPPRCQPGKAGLEEPFLLRRADGTVPAPEEVASIALQPVRVAEDRDARQ